MSATNSSKQSIFNDKEQHIQYQLLKDEIEDFIDENTINQSSVDITDIDKCIDEVTRLWSQFRITCLELSNLKSTEEYESVYSHEIDLTLANIKEYNNQHQRKKI